MDEVQAYHMNKTLKTIRNIGAMILIVLITLPFMINRCHADKWTPQEKVAEAVWIGLHILDWGTTRDIAMNPTEYREVGPVRLLIGEHPSTQSVDLVMGLSTILHPLVTDWLPRKAMVFGYEINPRAMWQYISIGSTGACVVNNFSIGLHVRF